MSKKLTEKRLLEIYIKVEQFREKHPALKIIDATRAVARELYNIKQEKEQMSEKERKKLTREENYVHRKYYEMIESLKGISLKEVKAQFNNAKKNSKYVSKLE